MDERVGPLRRLSKKWEVSRSVVSDSLRPHGLYSSWNSLGQNIGVGSPSLLQGIFPTQGSNPGLPHCRRILYQLSHKGSPKKTEGQRINAFKLWCWRRLLRLPWTAKRSNQLILKEINPEYSLEGVMLKLKLQYFGHQMRRPWCWERLKAGGEGDDRGWDGWMASSTWWTWVWASSRSWWRTGKPGVLQSLGSQRVGTTEQLSHSRPFSWTSLLAL